MALIFVLAEGHLSAQQSLTWDQVKARFEASNPALKADADNVDEMRAEEITAYLRPNPQLSVTADGTQIAPHPRRLGAPRRHVCRARRELPARARSQT